MVIVEVNFTKENKVDYGSVWLELLIWPWIGSATLEFATKGVSASNQHVSPLEENIFYDHTPTMSLMSRLRKIPEYKWNKSCDMTQFYIYYTYFLL
jgi:hypothetical protein